MERTININKAKKIMGSNFIGLDELISIKERIGIYIPEELKTNCPLIHFSEETLEKSKNDYLLILGIPYFKDKTPLTIVKMREHFGCDPSKSEPCFYNQDWYLNDPFAFKKTFLNKWYLIKKTVFEEFRGHLPNQFFGNKNFNKKLPSAVVITYLFFANYFVNKREVLWERDFIWSSDHDIKGDKIYVGRYMYPKKINKNGFNIHRYLTIDNSYSIIETIEKYYK